VCSSQPPENGADSDPALWVHEQGTLVTGPRAQDLLDRVLNPAGARWVKRAVNGGWDVPKGHGDKPQEEVSE
jgi:predicted NUDIX family NTP pyrophosphohydrolase